MSRHQATSADIARLHELRERCLVHGQVIREQVGDKLSLPSKLLRHPLLTVGTTSALALVAAPLMLRAAGRLRSGGRATSFMRGAGSGWAGVASILAAPLIDFALQSALKWLEQRQPPAPPRKGRELLPLNPSNHSSNPTRSRL